MDDVDLLAGLDDIPWATLDHAYGTAEDVPDLLRQLLDPDPDERMGALWHLYGNIFHQGTRYPATPYAIPFVIRLAADPAMPDRVEILKLWGDLNTGGTDIRDHWPLAAGEAAPVVKPSPIPVGDDEVYDNSYLAAIKTESLRGLDLLGTLLADPEAGVRAQAAYVLAGLPAGAERSVPWLAARTDPEVEPVGWVRSAVAFALGELGATEAVRRLGDDPDPAARCLATCQLARLEPTADRLPALLAIIAAPAIIDYDEIPGAGGDSCGDAAHAVGWLPRAVQERAIPILFDRLDRVRFRDAEQVFGTIVAAAFSRRIEEITALTDLQHSTLRRLLDRSEVWSHGLLPSEARGYGLPLGQDDCAALVGVRVSHDEASERLENALIWCEIGRWADAREGIDAALTLDPAVFERANAPEECWLLCAAAFAESDPERALTALHNAMTIRPEVALRIRPSWPLVGLLDEATRRWRA